MEFEEAKEKFIQAWGVLGAQWGINRTMAQIHALLLIAPDAMNTEEIMEQLLVSRGNVNMNVRELMDWNLVRKEIRPGERREYFIAEKDIWKVARLIIAQRKKKELEPVMELLLEVNQLNEKPTSKEVLAFKSTVDNIRQFTEDADKTLDRIIAADKNWFNSTLMRLIQ